MAYYPGQKVKSTNPRKITLAKLLTLVGILSAVYFGFTFVPPYWRYYQAKEVMAEGANKGYSHRRQGDEWDEIRDKMMHEVRVALENHLKVEPSDLHVEMTHKKGDAIIKASWTDRTKWPFLSKRTALKFKESFEMPLR